MSSGSSTNIINGLYMSYIHHSATVIFILSNINIPKNYRFFSFLTKFNTGYLPLYSGCSMHHCSHSGIRHPSRACCSIVVPSSILHLVKYGKIGSMLYHDWSLLLSFLCFVFCLFSCIKGNLCDNLYL